MRVYTFTILRKDKLPQVYQKCQAAGGGSTMWQSGYPWSYGIVDCVFGGSAVTVYREGSTVSTALLVA